MRASIIVPALNEARTIVATLAPLQALRAGHELIVVDGGSTDATTALAAPLADRFYVMEHGMIVKQFAQNELTQNMGMLQEYLGV